MPTTCDNFERDDAGGIHRLWRDRKRASAKLADAYAALGRPYRALARRMRGCADQLEIDSYAAPQGEPFERLRFGLFCRARLCPTCQPLRARKQFFMLAELVAALGVQRPDDHTLLLTLTSRNVEGEALAGEMDRLLGGFRKLIRRKRVARAVTAWWRTLEITRNPVTGTFHAHLHVLVFVVPDYFDRSSDLYIDQKRHEWTALWRSCLKVAYDPIVDIRAVRGLGGGTLTAAGRGALAEVAKYVTKPGTLIETVGEGVDVIDHEALRAVDHAVHGRRLVSTGGALRRIARALKQPDPDGDDVFIYSADKLPPGAVWLGRTRWTWDGDDHVRWEPGAAFHARDGHEFSGGAAGV